MCLVIVAAFLYAPPARGLGETSRILFFHVPTAWVTTLAFLLALVYSIRYLVKKDLRMDQVAATSAEMGLLFCALATVTGSIWSRVAWGSWWNWDPRQTSIFLLLLIYGAYLALRSAIGGAERRARLSAVYAILAGLTVPYFMFVVPRITSSLHPEPILNADRRIEMDARMLQVFFGSLAGFTALFFWILSLRLRAERAFQRARES
jgi:heme exporter protein C